MQGVRTTLIGVAIGLAGAYALSRFLQTLLFGVGQHDVSVFVGVPLLLFAVAVAACYIPARRATEIDPIEALRES